VKILVVGSGGREHSNYFGNYHKDSKVKKIYCAPGNGGISELAECVPILATEVRKNCGLG